MNRGAGASGNQTPSPLADSPSLGGLGA
jgi:hypothetical protein